MCRHVESKPGRHAPSEVNVWASATGRINSIDLLSTGKILFVTSRLYLGIDIHRDGFGRRAGRIECGERDFIRTTVEAVSQNGQRIPGQGNSFLDQVQAGLHVGGSVAVEGILLFNTDETFARLIVSGPVIVGRVSAGLTFTVMVLVTVPAELVAKA